MTVVGICETGRDDLIEELEFALAEARRNPKFGLIAYMYTPDGGRWVWSNISADEAMGCACRLIHQINKRWDEE